MGFPDSIPDIQPFLELHTSSWTRVYKAYQPSLARYVLLKMLDPILSRDPENATWFTSEAQLTARIKHPNVVAIYSYGDSEHGLYYTAEFVDGVSLRAVLDRGPVPLEIALYIFEQIAVGLHAVHRQDVLHRDLKPDNVLIGYDGQVKLADFGFASVHGESPEDDTIKGSIGYLAPELLFESPPSPASDLFALGAILFELLGARRPFNDESMSAYLEDVQQYDPASSLESNPLLPSLLIELCRKLLEKKQTDRFQQIDDVLEMLQGVRNESSHIPNVVTFSKWLEAPETYVSSPSPKPVPSLQPVKPAQAVDEPRATASNVSWGAWIAALLMVGAVGIWFWFMPSPVNLEADTETEDPAISVSTGVEENEARVDSVTELTENPELSANNGQDAVQPPGLSVVLSDATEQLEVSIGRTDIELPITDSGQTDAMEPEAGHLAILCLPSCDVRVNGELLGHAPPLLSLTLPSGQYPVELLNEDFPPYEMMVFIEPGQYDTLQVPLLATVGTLDLTVSPWGHVYVDSTYQGVFPQINPFC